VLALVICDVGIASDTGAAPARRAVRIDWSADRVSFPQAGSRQVDPMRTVNDAVQDGVAERGIAEYFMMP
jgi:hypothetical protein